MSVSTTPLSRRLQEIAGLVSMDAYLLDIGTDHAYLPAFLAEKGIIKGAIAGELNEGPYKAALQYIEKTGLQNVVDVRQGNGFAVLRPGDRVTDVVIAGMGGRLMTSILADGRPFLAGIKRLILQPNVGADLVRKWLFENGWRLVEETILEEAGHIYEIIAAKPGVETHYPMEEHEREWLFRFGPILLSRKTPLLRKKWEGECRKWKRVAERMARSEDAEVKKKRQQLLNGIQSLEERLKCMQMGRP